MSQDFETPPPTPTPTPNPDRPAARTGPKLKIPVPPDLPDHDPEHGTPMRRLSTMVGINMLMLLTSLLLLGYTIFLERKATPTAEAVETRTATPEVKPEVDQLRAEIKDLTKKLDDRPAPPDPAPQIKSLDDKVADLGKAVAEMPVRLDTLGQKIEAASKGEGLAPMPKVEAIEKRVGEIAQTLDSVKAELSARPAPIAATVTPAPATAATEAGGMNPAVALFKAGKYAEARDAFAGLRAGSAEDARFWYYSALSTGLATRDWKGEAEKLVATGMAREKAGTPDRAAIDAAFADLNINNGKDWLSYYRGRVAR